MTTFHIITIFPDIFESYLNDSMMARAIRGRQIKVRFYNPRDFTRDKHRKVDDKPYGGGPGMVMKAEPVIKAVAKAIARQKNTKVIILSPRGRQFTNREAIEWSKKYKNLVLIAGHYEGIDGRVKKTLKATEISVGPYVLTGGELPAMMIMDAVTRQIPGVLGKSESLEEKRVTNGEVYTRPEEIIFQNKKYKVPKVLLSGDHKKIEKWRS